MITVSSIPILRRQLQLWRSERQSIALVPTMGNLHAGHLMLVKQAASVAKRVVVSVFVNPLQFGPSEDYQNYPRTIDADRQRLLRSGADILFTPRVNEMYPNGMEATTRVEVPKISEVLCGAMRPGHFVGVATVVNKLFNIVQPDRALFGEKDYQQLLVIKRMVADLYLPIEIIGVPTVRESDGLAMSSRNGYLNEQQRKLAPQLFKILTEVKAKIKNGEKNFSLLEQQAMTRLTEGGLVPDYVAIRTAQTLEIPSARNRELVILVAARLGPVRLIDNIIFYT
jgi:pantoate--beta-alanine ligase